MFFSKILYGLEYKWGYIVIISNNREIRRNYMKMMNMMNASSNDTNTSIEFYGDVMGSSKFGYGFENTNTDTLVDFLKIEPS